jgi:hypothetical protein
VEILSFSPVVFFFWEQTAGKMPTKVAMPPLEMRQSRSFSPAYPKNGTRLLD